MPAKRNYWLIKSEPSVYSWDRLVADGSTAWDGVRNFEARNNLRAMKPGDLAFFYHSNEGKEIVGVARVVREAYQDPTTDDDWSVVDFAPVVKLEAPVGLDAIRVHKTLKNMAMIKKNRISVTPVTREEFDAVLAAGRTRLPART